MVGRCLPNEGGSMKVIPIRRDSFVSEGRGEVAELAYELWLARFGMCYGPPEDDLARAHRELTGRTSNSRSPITRLFLVRRSGSACGGAG
jgi:hypothetical protein